MERFFPVSEPTLNGNEKKYVMDCLETTWISSNGTYINRFETEFAEFCQVKHAISCSNGTTALHLALLAHEVTQGDEVIIPTLTYIATANAVVYCGAKPVFVDVEEDTWNINPFEIEEKITSKTKGIIVVHLYGHPVDMDPVMEIAKKHGLFVIEDAAEAIGATYKGKKVGSIAHTSIFSLFGNKIVTTGEGGMVTTNDDSLAKRVRLLKGQGMDPDRRYWFPIVGYNYRMTNIQAAIGCAQLERVEWHIEQRKRIAGLYHKYLKENNEMTLPVEKEWAKNVFWMYSVVLNDASESVRDEVMQKLREEGIETRPFFYPMHILPPYVGLQQSKEFPVSNRISKQGINVPTFASLTSDDIAYISNKLSNVVHSVIHSR
jgi:perosamine synthetase